MKRSRGRSYTTILRKVLIWSKPAFMRESDANTIPAPTLRANAVGHEDTPDSEDASILPR